MISRNLVLKIAAFALIVCFSTQAFAQSAPRQERLLNGLKVLMFPNPGADKVSIKVRIHSGTSFDPQGKEGVMALLADSFFPTEVSQTFFKEDLGGHLLVTANYDYIQIDASAKPEEFLTLIEAISSAVSNPTIDKETTPKLVAQRLEKLKELGADPAYVADRAVAKRLFGKFPYGRPELGTPESVGKLTFADVLDIKQRFLASDNATVTISGKIDPSLAYRASRRYLGAWLKSDRLAPSTFEQPAAPDTKMAMVSVDGETGQQVRFALRGLAKNDKDYPPSQILTFILEDRLKQNSTTGIPVVRHCAHILPGSVVFSIQGSGEVAENLPTLLLAKPITQAEFDSAKARLISAVNAIPAEDVWLNVDTYKLTSAASVLGSVPAATLADVQRVAERLAKNPVVAVTVVKAEKSATN